MSYGNAAQAKIKPDHFNSSESNHWAPQKYHHFNQELSTHNIILMSTYNICFYGELYRKLSFNYHQIPPFICSTDYLQDFILQHAGV